VFFIFRAFQFKNRKGRGGADHPLADEGGEGGSGDPPPPPLGVFQPSCRTLGRGAAGSFRLGQAEDDLNYRCGNINKNKQPIVSHLRAYAREEEKISLELL